MHTPTETIRPNLTESKTQLNPALSGFTPGLLEWTHSKPNVNTEWPQRVYFPESRFYMSIRNIQEIRITGSKMVNKIQVSFTLQSVQLTPKASISGTPES